MIDYHLDANPPYIIAPVDKPWEVDDALEPYGYLVGDSWWAYDPSQEQSDGRWLLYVTPINQYHVNKIDAYLQALVDLNEKYEQSVRDLVAKTVEANELNTELAKVKAENSKLQVAERLRTHEWRLRKEQVDRLLREKTDLGEQLTYTQRTLRTLWESK